MVCLSVLTELASHNEDIRRLLEKGYALRYDSNYLVVRDIPYLDGQRALQWGAFVTKLESIDGMKVKQDDHQVFFAGSVPYGLDGRPVPNLAGGPRTIPLNNTDVVVERSFSNKPPNGFANFFDKVEHYLAIIGGPAIELHGANPFTFRVDHDAVGDSVFKFHDTLTSRAEIGDLAKLFNEEVVAIIGLGGTGAYVLDFLVKTPVKEIRAFDPDVYHVHNAFRSPGKLETEELGKGKAEVYQERYENFRHGLTVQRKRIDNSSANDLVGVNFAFVCVDSGSSRKGIFELLIGLGIPFIDVGMGLNRKQGAIAGAVRATHYASDNAKRVRDMGLAEMVDHPDDAYRANIQISELNALNACLAVIRYKQLKSFYVDDNASYHLLADIPALKLFLESEQ